MNEKLKKDFRKVFDKFEEDYIYSYKNVTMIFDELNEVSTDQFIDCEEIFGSLTDNYLFDVSDIYDDFQYILFKETFINEWSSGYSKYFIKDDEELTERFPWIILRRMIEEDE